MGSRAKGSGQQQQGGSNVLPTVMSVAQTIGGDSLAGGQQVNAPPPLAAAPAPQQTRQMWQGTGQPVDRMMLANVMRNRNGLPSGYIQPTGYAGAGNF